ncbi:1-acyl-sn-glycerol-3-phosphate acyltransferase [bacterium]|nr:1-acyl-sn-glycerol-3-phosphate acyltransferase [bacterium]
MTSRWGKIIYTCAKGMLWMLARLMFRYRIHNRQRAPLAGPLLVASNHVSHLDPPLVGISLPRMVFNMAKKELFTQPLLMRFMRCIGTILVDRGKGTQALVDACKYLENGQCIVIFPEGTRSQDGTLQRGRSGVIVLAIRANCPILPVAICGSEKAMTKGSKRIKPVPINVYYGEPYRIAYQGDRQNIPREVLRRETYFLMEQIEALLPERMRPDPQIKRVWYREAQSNEINASTT